MSGLRPKPTVVITGASSGIGRALAIRWAGRGAHVVANARDASALEALAAEIRAGTGGGDVLTIAGDVTRAEDRKHLVDEARAWRGTIDVLVNNAGRGYYGAARDIDLADFEALFALNVIAPLGLVQLAYDDLARSHGTVVMMSSIAGVAAAPKMAAYAATKFALEALAMSMRAELATDGVRVLVVRPGPVDTPFRENSMATAGTEAGVRPKGAKVQTPEEVARLIMNAVASRRDVLETSLFVRFGSFGARVVPPIFRAVTRKMARP